MYVINCFTFT